MSIEEKMEEKEERLAKKIAESGVASRREAERLIEEGRIKVDGEVINTPVFFVSSKSVITIDERPIPKKKDGIVIWKFYKPVGVITSRRDSKGRPTVFDYLNDVNDRLLCVGRLDCNSEGLLLFVNDGDLARKMELPSTALQRTYRVRIFGRLSDEAKEKLKRGVTVDGIKYGGMIVEEENPRNGSKNCWVKVTLSEGKNREIRRLMQYFNCSVNRLIRIRYGPFELGKLQPGEFTKVDGNEIRGFLTRMKG